MAMSSFDPWLRKPAPQPGSPLPPEPVPLQGSFEQDLQKLTPTPAQQEQEPVQKKRTGGEIVEGVFGKMLEAYTNQYKAPSMPKVGNVIGLTPELVQNLNATIYQRGRDQQADSLEQQRMSENTRQFNTEAARFEADRASREKLAGQDTESSNRQAALNAQTEREVANARVQEERIAAQNAFQNELIMLQKETEQKKALADYDRNNPDPRDKAANEYYSSLTKKNQQEIDQNNLKGTTVQNEDGSKDYYWTDDEMILVADIKDKAMENPNVRDGVLSFDDQLVIDLRRNKTFFKPEGQAAIDDLIESYEAEGAGETTDYVWEGDGLVQTPSAGGAVVEKVAPPTPVAPMAFRESGPTPLFPEYSGRSTPVDPSVGTYGAAPTPAFGLMDLYNTPVSSRKKSDYAAQPSSEYLSPKDKLKLMR